MYVPWGFRLNKRLQEAKDFEERLQMPPEGKRGKKTEALVKNSVCSTHSPIHLAKQGEDRKLHQIFNTKIDI